MPGIIGLGHVGIHTRDLTKMRDFYTRVMGLRISDEDLARRGIVFLSADPAHEHHELVLTTGRDAPPDVKIVQQISFKVESVNDLKDFYRRLRVERMAIDAFVSHGNALGLYFFDPEGNRIEVYYKTGFPVPQPRVDPLDIEAPSDEWLTIARAAIPESRR